MQARIVPAARGAHWLAEGWRCFRAAPLGWLTLVFAYLLLTQLMALVPLVGSAAAAVLVPAFTVGLMAAARATSAGAKLELGMLFEGFRHGVRGQLFLGAVYLACILLVFALTAMADPEGAMRTVLSGNRPAEELEPADVLGPLMAFALAYAPVMMMFWFAPPLSAWHGAGAAKALFFSFFGFLINWRAFLAYGVVAAALMLALPFVVISAVMLAAGGAHKLQASSLMIPLLLVMLPTLFASFYASYRDVFGAREGDAV